MFSVLNKQEDNSHDADEMYSPVNVLNALRYRRWIISHDEQVFCFCSHGIVYHFSYFYTSLYDTKTQKKQSFVIVYFPMLLFICLFKVCTCMTITHDVLKPSCFNMFSIILRSFHIIIPSDDLSKLKFFSMLLLFLFNQCKSTQSCLYPIIKPPIENDPFIFIF